MAERREGNCGSGCICSASRYKEKEPVRIGRLRE